MAGRARAGREGHRDRAASAALALHRFRLDDSTGIDEASRTVLFDSGAEAVYATSVALVKDGTCFLLDRRCQDVLVAVDTDADTWPDRLRWTPFARSADFDALREAVILYAESRDRAHTSERIPTDVIDEDKTARIYRDGDGDLIADRE